MMLLEHIQNSYQSLRSMRTRTLLTTLGVAIGVASMTAILSLSTGVTQVISNQVEALDGNIAIVRPSAGKQQSTNLTAPTLNQMYATSSLTEEDLDVITELEDVEAVAPIMVINGSLHNDDRELANSTVVATTPDLPQVANLSIDKGQFMDDITNGDTAVLGKQLAIDLFGTDQPIGQTFTLRGQTFRVIGVLQSTNDPINFNLVDFDQAALISLDSGKSFNQGIAQIQQINIQADTSQNLDGLIKEVNQVLTESHLGETDFTVGSGQEIVQPTGSSFQTIAAVMTAIAGISLVVGGIGIMNIMLVGVAERTREIGLRKAVGASNGNIVMQFLVESIMISLLGGILGYAGGYLLSLFISTWLTFNPALTWEIAGAALVISLSVGIIFGIYPAIRAARKDPIESLRHYH